MDSSHHFSIEEIVKAPGAFAVRVPASTSNLGAGFDCISLALQLYLTVQARVAPDANEPCRVLSRGEGAADGELSGGGENLIFRAMRFAAEREGLRLPPVQLDVHNELPLGRGLGSSAAAIVAGITLASLICNRPMSPDAVLRCASVMEGHADNVTAAVHGGLVVTCVRPDETVLILKRNWPPDLKVIVVSPEARLQTAEARRVLPEVVAFDDAVYNLQRAVLLAAALEAGAYDLLWEAMRDRLHQRYRESLVPGLAEALATPPQPGLRGIALSGSGPSVIALADDRLPEIGEEIANSFRRRGLGATVRLLEVDREGLKTHVGKEGDFDFRNAGLTSF